MRWDGLFADLEAQAAALEQADTAAAVADRTRGEIGGLRLLDRARAAIGQSIRVQLLPALACSGVLVRVGPDWLLLDEGAGREALVAIDHVMRVHGLGRYAAVPGSEGVIASRLGLRHALRGIARDRSAVRAHLVDGAAVDATIDRVGADFLELAVHSAAEPRRRRDVREVELVPLRSLVAVRRGS